jgi:SAM-dependent methyltransferase
VTDKPAYLGRDKALAFSDPSVAAAYRYRAPYPPETFEILTGLLLDEPRTVLDAGCGDGPLARALAPLVERVDALDISRPMIEHGRCRPGGDHPHLRWRQGDAETGPVDPPYSLIACGASLHWMDWDVVLPRFAGLLTEHGSLAIVGVRPGERPPWGERVRVLGERYSTNPDYRPFDMLPELERRGLWRQEGKRTTAPVPFRQSIDDFLEAMHSQSICSRDRMRPQDVAAFDAAVRGVVTPYTWRGTFEVRIHAEVVWGKPLRPYAESHV